MNQGSAKTWLGEAARGKDAKVILGTVGLGLRPWFIETSGLSGEQVTNGILGVQCYPPKAVTLPVHAPTDPKLVANADAAYVHCFDYGFAVDDSSPVAAQGFAELYNACGVSRCAIKPALQYSAEIAPIFAVFAACELMDWPKFARIHEDAELWELGSRGCQGSTRPGHPWGSRSKDAKPDHGSGLRGGARQALMWPGVGCSANRWRSVAFN